jgi:N-acetylglucosaminyl-diphospho-decaprenol L-rhamnosyltransferase
MISMPAISITIVLYNSRDVVRECLRSLRPDLESGFAELIAVDNCSPDDSADLVRAEWPSARIVRSEENLGFAAGCNLAWPLTGSEYWMLLNPDVVVPAGGLRRLAGWMDRRPELGAGSPQLVDQGGKPQGAPRRFATLSQSLLMMSRLHRLLPAKQRGQLFLGSYWDDDEHLDIDWAPGTALIVRRDAVRDAGLLSERFFMYGEDIEWCWRIRKAGWRIGVLGQLGFRHGGSVSATQTWGAAERDRRVLQGLYNACRETRGRAYTKILMAIDALAASVESIHPFRSSEWRAMHRRQLGLHLEMIRQ